MRVHLSPLIAIAYCLLCGSALAQFPSKPARLIVPFAAGGIVDIIARPVAEQIGARWGQPVLVEARPGANGAIAAELVAKAPADGHTWFLTTLSHVVNPAFSKSVPYHPTQDFSAIGMVATVPALAVVHSSVPAQSLKELVALARTQPGKLNYLNPGIGTSMHLNTELLKLNAGIDLTSIPYKGLAPGVPDLVGGSLSFSFLSLPLATPHIKSGRLRALAIASPTRSAQFPEVPTIVEAGFPEAQVVSWYLITVSAKTPRDLVTRLNEELQRALNEPEVIRRLEQAGAHVSAAGRPEEADTLLRNETARWARFAREAKIESQ
jgi:tripartite-type tricarboxylate transporter receptor subunit TctC